jgi:hypothetical protein
VLVGRKGRRSASSRVTCVLLLSYHACGRWEVGGWVGGWVGILYVIVLLICVRCDVHIGGGGGGAV